MRKPNTFIEIGRVVDVDHRRFTLDVITESGRTLKSVPFLSAYSKGNHNGQGIYMIPEIDSYTLVVSTTPTGGRGLYGLETYCFGFFNPIDNKGSFSGGRESLMPGSAALKTAGHNKIILTTDGVIWIYSSDLAQIRLFPASGNIRDAAGLDHLLQILIENLELRTSGGGWNWNVNKKEESSNFRYEYRNKPLLVHNPDVMVGNIGSQGPLGDSLYFHTWRRYHHISEEERDIIRVSYAETTEGSVLLERFDEKERSLFLFSETNKGGRVRQTLNPETEEPFIEWSEDEFGNKTRKVYDGAGTLQHEIELKSTGEVEEKHYLDGDLVWSFQRGPSGDTKRTHYSGGSPTWEESIQSSGATEVSIPGDGSKTKITITPAGQIDIETEQDINLKTKSGSIKIESSSKEIILEAAQKVTVDAPLVDLAPEPKGQLLLDLAAKVYNEHTHTVETDEGEFTTSPPSELMTDAHWSKKVTSG